MKPRTLRQNLLLGINIFISVAIFYLLARMFQSFRWSEFVLMGVSIYILTALNQGSRIVSPNRLPLFDLSPEEMGGVYQEVEFESKDGLTLSGWYLPSQNRGVIILVHPWGSNRARMRFYARPLVDAGFGVLAFDLRSHSRSEGNISTWGWLEVNDLLGALNFAASRKDVDFDRIGVLGLALGGQIAIRGAAESVLAQAVWVDCPSVASLGDHATSGRATLSQRIFSPWVWISLKTQEFLTEESAPVPLIEIISKISPRPIQIVTSGPRWAKTNADRYYEKAGDPKDIWELSDVPYSGGIIERPDEYEERLVAFFDKHLLKSSE